ncbi:MAG: hypothetical protein A2126_04975 [Candidatus Woykebacteria bacterium GWB1_45_5]|uniref:Uncharacterized protein n=1 Tax=Candidatus Woykebacteria bacterium GWB1_45_5 TaxID=1802592 RepID=A0A1G1W990_9BACT|nr:MAG: hypothetical protein A2126_04975 [Candidatus Woykebacteria bacterium GWB1_45_5]
MDGNEIEVEIVGFRLEKNSFLGETGFILYIRFLSGSRPDSCVITKDLKLLYNIGRMLGEEALRRDGPPKQVVGLFNPTTCNVTNLQYRPVEEEQIEPTPESTLVLAGLPSP